MNGYVKNGHYFLGNHGQYIEVSKFIWTYSYYHTLSVIIAYALVLLLLAIYANTGDMSLERT